MEKRVCLLSKRGKPLEGFLVDTYIINNSTGILFCLRGELFLRITYMTWMQDKHMLGICFVYKQLKQKE